jgi:hypothetical protein
VRDEGREGFCAASEVFVQEGVTVQSLGEGTYERKNETQGPLRLRSGQALHSAVHRFAMNCFGRDDNVVVFRW